MADRYSSGKTRPAVNRRATNTKPYRAVQAIGLCMFSLVL